MKRNGEGEQFFLPPQHFLTASPDSLIETSSHLWFLFSTSEAEAEPLVWNLNKLELKSPQRGNWERLLSASTPLCMEREGRSDIFSPGGPGKQEPKSKQPQVGDA